MIPLGFLVIKVHEQSLKVSDYADYSVWLHQLLKSVFLNPKYAAD
jgi:hypothetical protein